MKDHASRARAELDKLFEIYLAREAQLPPDEWCEAHIRLSHRQSVASGAYSLDRTPYLRQIYKDAVDPRVRSVAIMKSAQIGYSQLLSNLCFYFVCNKTNPIGIIFPSQALSQQWSERNLHAGLEGCRPIEKFITGRLDDIRRSEFTFKSCNLKVIGGGSANKLSSNNICYLFLDEIDKFEGFLNEANVIELAIDRTISYQESGAAMILMGSTPTLKDSSEIEKHYEEGTRCKFHVPCPSCGLHQELVFGQVKWNSDKDQDGERNLAQAEATTFYECIGCKGRIEEKDKARLIMRGHWVSTNPKAPADTKSYHISALYSPSLTWGYVARQFLNSKNDRTRLQNFHNSILGLPWQPQTATITEHSLDALVAASPKYQKGSLPKKPKAILMGVDVQQSCFYYMMTAIYDDGKTAIIDYGTVVGLEDLALMAETQYTVRGEAEAFPIYGCFIDAGYRTTDIYRFCRDSNMFFVPTFGRTAKHKMFSPIRKSEILFDNTYLTIISINDTLFSTNLLVGLLKEGVEDAVWLPQDSDKLLKQQLSSVSIKEKRNAKGFTEREIVSRSDNHLFDCLKMCSAMFYFIRPELDTPKQVEKETPAPVQADPRMNYADSGGW